MNKRLIINLENNTGYIITEQYIIDCNNKQFNIENKFELIEQLEKSSFLRIHLDTYKSAISEQQTIHYETLRTNGKLIWSADLNIYFSNDSFIWPSEIIRLLPFTKAPNLPLLAKRCSDDSFIKNIAFTNL